jgi:hypothetical protein
MFGAWAPCRSKFEALKFLISTIGKIMEKKT